MTVETLQMLSTVAYVLAGIFLLAAIAIFFLLDIRSVIGDVTGATARKAIRDIRAQNEASGNKAYKPSPVNAARGKLTAKMCRRDSGCVSWRPGSGSGAARRRRTMSR